MKKRIISGLLAVWMLCALLPGAAAAPALPTEEEAAQVLAALEIMVGDENGNLNLDKKVSRAEFIKMAVAATPGGTGVGSAAISPYSDVPRSHWAAGYIQTAVETGLITGYLDGTFRPDNTITLAEGVTVALRLLGWQNSDFSATYPTGQMAKYRDLDLDRGVSAGQNDQLSRRDCMYLFHNLLTAPSRSANSPYICVLGHALTASGQIDRVELISSAMEGPVVVSEGWTKQVTFAPSSARTVYRDGKPADYSDLLDNDVVYYSKSMRTLWAYSKKATGTVTAITPTTSPTSVTVAGVTYPIETASAAYALSDLGSYKTGDTVTLLLGRTGGVAAVLSAESVSDLLFGLVEAVTPARYADAQGNLYTANSLAVRLTDGSLRSFRYDGSDIEADDLVQIFPAGSSVSVRLLSSSSLSGTVSSDGKKLGQLSFAQNVEILDTCRNTGFRVWPSRLAGTSINENDVRYYCLNAAGEISHLILNDLTGDGYQFGILLDLNTTEIELYSLNIYTYDIGGQTISTQLVNTSFSVEEGPARFFHVNDTLTHISGLSSLPVSSVSGRTAMADGKAWPISDQAAVYELRDGEYYFSSLSIVEKGGYTFTGYYDLPPSSGGQIRVLVAVAK